MKQPAFLLFILVVALLTGCRRRLLPQPDRIVAEPTAVVTATRPAAELPATATEPASPTQVPSVTATRLGTAATAMAGIPLLPTVALEGVPRAPTITPRPTATITPSPTLPSPPPVSGIPVISWSNIGTPLPPAAEQIVPENLSALVEVGRWGKGKILEAAYSPDGTRLFVLTEQGLYLYEVATAALLIFHPHAGRPIGMALSPDGQRLALGMSQPHYIEVRDAQSFALLGAFYPFGEPLVPVAGLQFDRSSRHLFVRAGWFVQDDAERLPAVVAWDAVTFTRVAELDVAGGFAYASQANLVVTGIDDGMLQLWQWQDQGFTPLNQIPIPERLAGWHLLALSPDGEYVAVSGEIANPLVAVLRANSAELLYIVNSSRRGTVAAAVEARRFRAARGLPPFLSGPGRDYPEQLLFSPDSRQLAVTTGYDDLTIYEAAGGVTVQEWAEIGDRMLFHPSGAHVAAWRYSLAQWRIADGAPINSLTQHIGPINDLSLLPRRRQLAIASADGYLYLRQLQTGDLVARLHAGISNETGFSGPSARSMDVTADEQTLVSASNDAYRVWNLSDYSMTRLSAQPRGDVGASQIVISPDGQYILGQEYDSSVWLWTGRQTEASEAPFFSPAPMAFSPVAPLLAIADSFTEVLLLWQPALGESTLLPKSAQASSIETFAFSADGCYLAGTMSDESFMVWEIMGAEGKLLFTSPPGELYTYNTSAAFAPDNRMLAQSVGHLVRFWDMAEGTLLYSLDTGLDIRALLFTVDGRYLVTGHWDGSVRFWSVQ